ncbi:D-beta-hydroxybutyrate dehydrogenase, mitochondrial-like [Amphiura filiformis]|uniref:D-beta-hydroxybutyrate dehydrogenase, mitochondrial-like n=1 Tax=Amphiura filiformis TaxID=82378 RepID=UPI003B2205AB
MEDYKKVTEVNLFGGIRVIRTFLPLIRKAEGRILNTTSILGRKATVGRSCYVASKHAMEGFTQCLRLEMKQWNVRVSTIEPGNFVSATGIFTKEKVQTLASKMWDNMPESIQQDYGRQRFDDYARKMENFVTGGCKEMTPVINCIEKALFDKKPRIRYCPKTFDEHVLSFVMTHFPHELSDFIYNL